MSPFRIPCRDDQAAGKITFIRLLNAIYSIVVHLTGECCIIYLCEVRMKLRLFQIDAFSDAVFHGNPAAVCPLDSWLDDDTMQKIASENNLSETAFFVKTGTGFHIRWFTPLTEVELCGHATLATAHVIFNHYGYNEPAIAFTSLSGDLTVSREGSLYVLDFPAYPPEKCPVPEQLLAAFDIKPEAVLRANYYLVVFNNENQIRSIKPDFEALKALDNGEVIITAPGDEVDFVSRFFAPAVGIDEDPVTGSAHCALTPYWAGQLKKTTLTARQVSDRGGQLECRMSDNRVRIAGAAADYLEGIIFIP